MGERRGRAQVRGAGRARSGAAILLVGSGGGGAAETGPGLPGRGGA